MFGKFNWSKARTNIINADKWVNSSIKTKGDLLKDVSIKTENKVELGTPANKKMFLMIGLGLAGLLILAKKLKSKNRRR